MIGQEPTSNRPMTAGCRFLRGTVVLLGVGAALFHLLQALVVMLPAHRMYILHAFIVVALLCSFSAQELLLGRWQEGRSRWRLWGWVLVAVLGLGGLAYVWFQADRLDFTWPFIGWTDIVVGFLLISVVSLATWLVWGPPLALMGVCGVLYFLFGHWLPGLLGHSGFSTGYVVSYLGISLKTGLFWLANLSLATVFPLMIYAQLLHATGSVDGVIELIRACGRVTGVAPVFAAVFGSGVAGAVTDGPATNVILIGNATIPAMKRIGLEGETAASIEAVASTGAQVVPPVMGMAAFVMAELVGVPYSQVMLAAIIPAILYYLALMVSVYMASMNELARKGMAYPRHREEVDWQKIRSLLPTFFLSMGVVIGLLMYGLSPLYSCAVGVVATALLSQLQGPFRPKLAEVILGLRDGAISGAKVAIVLMSVGLMTQPLITTGVGLRLSRLLEGLIGGNLFLGLAVLGFVTFTIGTGAPTVVAYIIAAIAVVPTVRDLGVPLFVAHFFTFYFACFSHVTPPDATAILLAARIANTDFFRTAWRACKIGWPVLLVPFLIVFEPQLLRPAEFSLRGSLLILAFLLTVVNGMGVLWHGLPAARLGVMPSVVLAIGTLVGWIYLYTGSSAYLIGLLVASCAGWGPAVVRRPLVVSEPA